MLHCIGFEEEIIRDKRVEAVIYSYSASCDSCNSYSAEPPPALHRLHDLSCLAQLRFPQPQTETRCSSARKHLPQANYLFPQPPKNNSKKLSPAARLCLCLSPSCDCTESQNPEPPSKLTQPCASGPATFMQGRPGRHDHSIFNIERVNTHHTAVSSASTSSPRLCYNGPRVWPMRSALFMWNAQR